MSLGLTLNGVETTVETGWHPLLGERTNEHYTWRVLDKLDTVLDDDLEGVESAHLVQNVAADTRGTGSLLWAGVVDDMPAWRDIRVQPVYHATVFDEDGTSYLVEWPAGVYLCSAPSDQHTAVDVEVDVQLFDKTLILRRAKITESYSLPAGTNVVTTVRSIISSHVTGKPAVIEDSSATLRSAMTWDPDTSWLTIINDLLDAIDYFALFADGEGVPRSMKRTDPQAREQSWDFVDATIVGDDLEHEHDDFDVPNKVTLVSRADGDQTELRSSITLDSINPTHPYSIAVSGQQVDYYEADVEASTHAVLDSKARRKLLDGLTITSTYRITHAPLPLPINARVHIERDDWLSADCVVQELAYDCVAGADFETELREVVE